MSELQIVCDNCGAKYRLPASFSNDKAKCKQCGSAIDVAAQRKAAAAPKGTSAPAQAARPASPARPAATARPATGSSRTSSRDAEPAAAERTGKGSRGGAERRARKSGGDDGEGDGHRRHRGGRDGDGAAKKSNNMPLIAGGIGLLAIVVVAIFLLRGGDKKDQVAAAAKSGDPKAAAPAANGGNQKPAEKPETPATGAPAEAAKPAETPAATPVPKVETPPPAAPAAPTEQKSAAAKASAESWEKLPPMSADQIFNPKKEVPEIVVPDSISTEDRRKVEELVSQVQGGGKSAIAAKRDLQAMGYKAIFGMVARLRELDYMNSDDAMFGFELNKLLETIFEDLNAGYVPVQVGEDVDPRKAHWNGKTVAVWARSVVKYQTEESFQDLLKAQREKRAKKESGK